MGAAKTVPVGKRIENVRTVYLTAETTALTLHVKLTLSLPIHQFGTLPILRPTASTEPVFTPQHQHVHNFSPSPEDLTPFVMQQDTLTVSSDQDSNQSHPLPGFTAIPTSNFQWGDKDGEYLTQKLDQCYKEVVHWRQE